MNTHPLPVYAGPIEVDALAPGPEPRRPAREYREPDRSSESRVARLLRRLWAEEPDEIEVRARRAAQLAREQAG